MASPVFFIDIGPDGIVAVHPQRLSLPALVAPIPEETVAKNLNTIREPLVAIGCMQLPHRQFEFDSSFIGPGAENRFTKFATLMDLLREQDEAADKDFPPLSVFGHADPVGKDGYNATLSGRRALAVYGVLTRDTALWDLLFKGHAGDEWGRRSVRLMLSTPLRKTPDETPDPFFVGPAEPATPADKAALEKQTDEAIKEYKRARPELAAKEPVSATLDEKTRKLLFLDYMNAICHFENLDAFQLDPVKHFIARAKDGKTLKGDVQGCGEFNPVMLLSKAEDELFKGAKELEEARNALNARNRRVIAYVFRHGTEIDPKKWPCPRVSNGIAGPGPDLEACKDRFWSDSAKRLELGEDRRQFGKEMELAVPDDDGNFEVDEAGRVVFRDIAETGNTMACRFYHGFAAYSPCEAGLKEWVVRFRLDGLTRPNEETRFVPLANRRYVLTMGEARQSAVVRGTLDAKGEIRIPVLDQHVLMTIRLDAFGDLLGSGTAKPPAEGEDPNKLVDGKFPDEDGFVALQLDAGALKKMRSDQDVGDLASRQRLYNLGFGPPKPATWNRERDQVPAARAYRQSRRLPDGADLRDALVEEHELRDATPLPPDDNDDPSITPPAP